LQYGFGKHPIADEKRHSGVLHFADYLSGGLLFIGHFRTIEAGEVVGGRGNLVSFAHPIEESKSGPPRKYFEITESGAHFLASLTHTWTELQFAVAHVSNSNPNE
jgi:hypothetical protein